MIEKINHNQISDLLKEPANQVKIPPAASGTEPDASLQINHEHLVDKAMQVPQEDSAAVQNARQLLLSGQLANPRNVREAAENILMYGI